MHHYQAILNHLMQAETELNDASKLANDNRGRGVDEGDVLRIVGARNAVNERLVWFKQSFEGRI
jgi:hypothetical protein